MNGQAKFNLQARKFLQIAPTRRNSSSKIIEKCIHRPQSMQISNGFRQCAAHEIVVKINVFQFGQISNGIRN